MKLSGTTMSYWDERCGDIVNSFEEFEDKFDNFFKNLDEFQPAYLVG